MSFPRFRPPKDGFGVLTLTEPWATLVVLGEKEWETRSWSTAYRGLLLIQAAKGMPRYAQAACLSEPFESVLAAHGMMFDVHPDSVGGERVQREVFARHFHFGSIIGAVNLADTRDTASLAADLRVMGTPRAMRELAFGNYEYGRRAFRFTRPQRFGMPVAVRGALGIWALEDPKLVAAIKPQLARAA